MPESDLKATVKSLALEAGFDRVGVASAAPLDDEVASRLQRWIEEKRRAGLDYVERHLPVRLDPGRLLPDARSVLCLAVGYAGADGGAAEDPAVGRIARFARGRDYHKVLKKRCRRLVRRMSDLQPDLRSRVFVDAGPVMERSLAVCAGLGWIGRNGCLICPGLGSYVLLAEVVSTLPLPPDEPVTGGCGTCARCVSACPTGALTSDGTVLVDRCVSYWNQQTGEVPAKMLEGLGRWLCGCDVCQEACPHNEEPPPGDAELAGEGALAGLPLAEVLSWSEDDWDRATRGRGLRCVKHAPMLRNAVIAAGNSGRSEFAEPLRALARRRQELEPLIREALDRLRFAGARC